VNIFNGLDYNIDPFNNRVRAFNASFKNISVITWWSVVIVEETGVPVENHRPVASQTLSNNKDRPYKIVVIA